VAVTLNPSRRHAEMGFATVLIAVATWAYLEANDYPAQSAGYPKVLAVLLGLGAIILAARTWFAASAEDPRRLFDHPGRFVLGFGLIFLYIVGIDQFGYIIPSLVLGIGLPALLGYRNWKLSVPVTVGTLIFIYIVFKLMLERPLPPDLLDGVLGAIL
jgi:hypothetical protein